jgi:hypothetical protein
MFQQFIAIIRGSYVPQKLLKQYLWCECIWITRCPVWPTVEGGDQACRFVASLDSWTHWTNLIPYTSTTQILSEQLLRYIWPPDDGNELLKHGVNLKCINKSYYYLDAFVGYFTTIFRNARFNYQDKTASLTAFGQSSSTTNHTTLWLPSLCVFSSVCSCYRH